MRRPIVPKCRFRLGNTFNNPTPRDGSLWSSIYGLVLELSSKFPLQVTCLAIGSAVLGLTEGLALIGLMLALSSDSSNLGVPFLSFFEISSEDFLSFSGSNLTNTLLFFLVIVLSHSALNFYISTARSRIRLQYGEELRDEIFDLLSRSSWVLFFKRKTSELLHCLTERVDDVSSSLHYLIDLFSILCLVGVYFVVSINLSASFTLVSVSSVFVILYLSRTGFRSLKNRASNYSDSRSEVYQVAQDLLAMTKFTKATGRGSNATQMFAAKTKKLKQALLEASMHSAKTQFYLRVAGASFLAGLMLVGHFVFGLENIQLVLFAGIFSRLILLFQTALLEINQLVELVPNYDSVDRLRRDCRKLLETFDLPGETLALTQGVQLSEVCFSYQFVENRRPTLDRVSLTIPAGKTTVLLGPSGAGKTTLVDVLFGLYTPQSGKILVDGVPLDKSRIHNWRMNCGYVPQEMQLISDSVRVNLCWGVPSLTDESIWSCLEKVELVEVVRGLELGLETQVGDRGVCLSGGERQRLALARALLSKPRFLALDEALSSVSPEQEFRILRNIRETYPLLTLFIVSHRKIETGISDLSYSFQDGRVIETKAESDQGALIVANISGISEGS